jgi:hypothetical protein
VRLTVALIMLLGLRATIPAGFMAAPTASGFEMVFCEPGALQGHAHHHPGHAVAEPSCPYAQSSGPAPLPVLPALAVDVRPAMRMQVVVPAAPIALSGPRRQQTSRGPPILA